MNGDGYGDILVGADGNGDDLALVFLGGPDGLSTSPSTTIHSPWGGGGMRPSSAGDVNGDGYADALASGSREWLYLGGPGGLATKPAATLGDGSGGASAGDVNGDGYADVIAGAGVYLGGPNGLSNTSSATLTLPMSFLGFVGATRGGDVNRDGFGDLVVSTSGGYDSTSALYTAVAYVFLGSASGIAASPLALDAYLSTGFESELVFNAEGPGDIDGDGFADVVVAGLLGVQVFPGGAAGPSAKPSATLPDLAF